MPRTTRTRRPTTGADVSVAAAPASAPAPVGPLVNEIAELVQDAPVLQEIAILTKRYGRLHRAVRVISTGVLLSAEQDNLDESTFDIVAEGAEAVAYAPHIVAYRKLCTRCFPQ